MEKYFFCVDCEQQKPIKQFYAEYVDGDCCNECALNAAREIEQLRREHCASIMVYDVEQNVPIRRNKL